MQKVILPILDRMTWLFRPLKVDFAKLRLIVKCKLTTDNRRSYMNVQSNSKKKKASSNTFSRSLLLYSFMGLMFALVMIPSPSLVLSATLVHAMIMIILAMALIADFTTVLIDTTDNIILLPRPVDGRTMAAARVTHITVYLMSISLALSFPVFLVGPFKYGLLFIPAFALTIFSTTLFTVFITNLFYLALFKFTSGEKFRDIIMYFQVFMAIFFMIGYQILPRLIKIEQLKNLTLVIKWWTFLIPPAWMGGAMEALVQGDFSASRIMLLLESILFPVLGIMLVIRVMAPNFSQKLSRLDVAEKSEKVKKQLGSGLVPILTRFTIPRSRPIERSAFAFIWKMSARDRKFKIKTYPSIGYIILFSYLFAFHFNKQAAGQVLQNLPQTQKFLFLIYTCAMLVLTAIPLMVFSENFKAAWIYHTLPVRNPGEILSGAVKSMICKFLIPVYILLSIGILIIWGWSTLDDLILGLVNNLFFSILVAWIYSRALPFSRKPLVADTSGRSARSFLSMLVFAAVGVGHYLIISHQWAVWTAAGVIGITTVYLFSRYGKLTWKQINIE